MPSLHSILPPTASDSLTNCSIFKSFPVCVILGLIGSIENMKLLAYMWHNVLKERFLDIMKEYPDCVAIDRSRLTMLLAEDGSKDCSQS